jgi:hypothetical protein
MGIDIGENFVILILVLQAIEVTIFIKRLSQIIVKGIRRSTMNISYRLCLAFVVIVSLGIANLQAQTYTEYFQDEITHSTVFTNNSNTFALTSLFKIYEWSGWGHTGDNRYVGNDNNLITGVIGSITNSSKDFCIHSLWIWPDIDNSGTPSNAGTVIFRGKLDGSTQFTQTVQSGDINTSNSVERGYTHVVFSSYNTILIDELSVELTGSLRYITIDDFEYSTDASLPVGLAAFSASQQGKVVVLNWITESEVDNAGFILERSGEDGAWIQIASYRTNDALKGQGNTSSRTEYSFTDVNVESGKQYSYRLSDVSAQGEVTAHAPLIVKTDALPEATEMEKAYPNPFNPQTFIAYRLAENTDVNISVFDMLGRQVKTLFNGNQTAGSYHVYWNGTTESGMNAPTGGYVIRMQAGNSTQVQKVILMK